MQYRVIDPTPEKLTEIARLSFNLMVAVRQWQKYYGSERRAVMQNSQNAIDNWMALNIEPDEDKVEKRVRFQWKDDLENSPKKENANY